MNDDVLDPPEVDDAELDAEQAEAEGLLADAEQAAAESEAQRFNPFHAPPGGPTGGEFAAGPASPSGAAQAGSPAAKKAKRLREEARALRARAARLDKELGLLLRSLRRRVAQHNQAVRLAKHAAAQARHQANQAKKHTRNAAKNHTHRRAAQHHKHAAHRHRKTASGHRSAIGSLHARISTLRGQIHKLRAQASALDAQASRLARAGLAHEQVGHTGKGLWHHKGLQLPAYMQHIANDLIEKRGIPESQAAHMAVGLCQKWKEGGGDVTAETQAKAAEAWAEWERLKASTHGAKASRSMDVTERPTYDADGLDQSWDSPAPDLPDLTGLTVADFDSAAGGDGSDATAVRAAKLGGGGRFKKLKSDLAAKGASDPGALAAYIGRKKFGKSKFAKLAGSARKGKAGKPAMARAENDVWFRPTVPLEVCEIVRTGEHGGSGRVVEAYATTFGEPAEIHDHEGDYVEDIDRAAFNRTLDHIGPDRNAGRWRVQVLYNHGLTVHGTPAERFSLPIGRTLHVSAEGRGLLTRTEYADTPLGNEILELVRGGMILSQSFTGRIIRSNPMLRPGQRYRAGAYGLPKVTRLELGLREYGPTPFPAYTGAEVVGVRMSPLGTWPGSDDGGPPEGAPADGDADYYEAPAPDGQPAAGGSADDLVGHPSRSVSNRIFRLRLDEQLAAAGITLHERK